MSQSSSTIPTLSPLALLGGRWSSTKRQETPKWPYMAHMPVYKYVSGGAVTQKKKGDDPASRTPRTPQYAETGFNRGRSHPPRFTCGGRDQLGTARCTKSTTPKPKSRLHSKQSAPTNCKLRADVQVVASAMLRACAHSTEQEQPKPAIRHSYPSARACTRKKAPEAW